MYAHTNMAALVSSGMPGVGSLQQVGQVPHYKETMRLLEVNHPGSKLALCIAKSLQELLALDPSLRPPLEGDF